MHGVPQTHGGRLLPHQLPMHPQELAAGFGGVTAAQKDPHQALLAVAAERVPGKRQCGGEHQGQADPIGDGGEPKGFREEHRRGRLRDHQADNGANPNLRVRSKTH